MSRAPALLYLHFPARCESTKRLTDRLLRGTHLVDEAALYLYFLYFCYFFSDYYRTVLRHCRFFVHLWKPGRCLQRFLFGSGAGDLSQTVHLGLVDFAFSNGPDFCLHVNRYGGDCLAGCLSYPHAEELLSRYVTFLDCLFQLCKTIFLRNFDHNA